MLKRVAMQALRLAKQTALAGIAALLVLGACTPSPSPAAPPTTSSAQGEHNATIMFFADAHADLLAHPEQFPRPDGTVELAQAGGYARLAHVARAIRKESPGALLVDGGDTFQGSAAASWSHGESVVAPQRALGVDLAVPGNWEVVYGPPQMVSLAKATGYPWLATNVVDKATGKLVFPPTLEREVAGVRFGFVGLTDPDVPTRQSPAYSEGLQFLGAESIGPYVQALRSRVDVVVLLTHIGLARSVSLAETVPGIDVVLSADTHERVREPIVRKNTIIVEPGAFASFLGRLDVRVTRGQRPTFTWKLLELRADRYPEDADVAAIVDESLAPYRAKASRVIGHAATSLERYGVLENTVDSVMVRALKERTGADIALSNGFRFGHPVAAGPITEADLFRLYPVNGPVKLGKVTGAQLQAFWESEIDHVFPRDPNALFGGWLPRVAGMKVVFRADAPLGHHVVSLDVNGKPLDPNATYTLASCEREGDAPDTMCRMKHVADAKAMSLDVHTMLRDWLGAHDPVSAPPLGNVVATDLPPHVFSQWERR